ncbi:hypothetical protein G7Z17_g6160 [Cylindrodendrum hubeiense]|uniref:Uncharacterized protein n=1 Tax=Cylindrodendrum hubeiense TaxID=595255 RepID=A0A9P5H5T5_9HYPO|nr:hypothetical protein G7Z17_g6160 [Cylindrodendrum hubeiense]
MYNSPGAVRPESEGHGLRFLNEEWNESISNGELFKLVWNETIDGTDAQLGVFRITYPRDGVKEYELVKNLTEFMESTTCEWTPDDLNDDLYSMWLTTVSNGNQSWTISPPWKLRNYRGRRLHWAAPVGIPIVVIVGLYAFSLITCLWHRRRKRLKRERDAANGNENTTNSQAADAEDAAGRHPSVSSVETAQTFDEPDFKKPGTVVVVAHEHPDFPTTELDQLPESRRGTWVETVHFDGVRFDQSRRGSNESVDDEERRDQPRRPEDFYGSFFSTQEQALKNMPPGNTVAENGLGLGDDHGVS